jgi:hypothetical protein
MGRDCAPVKSSRSRCATSTASGCSSIPFKATKAARIASGDPRPSVEERYPSYPEYRTKVVNAVNELVRRRFLICDDTQDIVNRLLQAGISAGVPTPKPNQDTTAPDPVQACRGHMPTNYRYHYHFEQDADGSHTTND